MRECEVEAYLVRCIAAIGGRAYKFTSPGRVGVPDRLLVLPGGLVVFVEVKAPGGRLSKPQAREIEALARLGAEIYVVYNWRDIESLVRVLQRRLR
jgi:hypothetical protein